MTVIVVGSNFLDKHLKQLKRIAEVKVVSSLKEIEHIENVEGIIGDGEIIDKNFIGMAKNLRIIAVAGLGYDHIDVKVAAEKGVFVTNARTAKEEETVANFAIGLIISISRRICEANLFVESGGWISELPIIGTDIYGKTLGIIGLGNIGTLVAERSIAFKMKTCYFDIIRREDLEENIGIQYKSLDTLLKESDYVTLHTPLTKGTYHLIGERELRLMKKTAYLINTSRGKVIDEEALIRALKNKWIAGATLDVFTVEPLPKDSLLLKLENVLLTPHIGGATEECIDRAIEVAVKDVIKCLSGDLPTKENTVVPITNYS